MYLGLPWATFIDLKRLPEGILNVIKVRISGFRHALKALGVDLHVHTVCQHIYWDRCLPIWVSLGVTDAWLSHTSSTINQSSLPVSVHPWALYAVNVEDPSRREGLEFRKNPAKKRYLASFIGAHMDHYVSDIRLRLRQFANEPRFLIRVLDKWHFEDVVYQHQIQQKPLGETYRIDDSVADYNTVLSDSIFALCPSGAGPNSLRLWEALAVGAIPVLLGEVPILPQGGSLPPIDWDSIAVRIEDSLLPELPRLLQQMSMDEIRVRQQKAMAAYALVCGQRCF
jgi:hypothetical protein